MTVFHLLTALLIVYAFFEYKNAFLAFQAFSLLLNQNLNLIALPGIPAISLKLTGNGILAVLYLIKCRRSSLISEVFPFQLPFSILAFSMLLSGLFSSVGAVSAVASAFQNILNNIFIPFVVWKVIDDKFTAKRFLNYLLVILIFLCSYAIYEKATGTNALIEYEGTLNHIAENVNLFRYSDDDRLGMGRIQSAIIHPIGFGCVISLIAFVVLIFAKKFKSIFDPPVVIYTALLMLIVACIFFTNSRGPLILFAILFAPFVDIRDHRTYVLFLVGIACMIIFSTYISPYYTNVISVFDSNAAAKVGGSDYAMRIDQFRFTFLKWAESPVLGHGINSTRDMIRSRQAILGAESVWITALIEQGAFGALAYSYLMISLFIHKRNGISRYLKYLTFGWLVVSSITSTPGCEIGFFLVIYLLADKAWIILSRSRLDAD